MQSMTRSRNNNPVFSMCFGLLLTLLCITSATADEITLNLKDADIRALISTVSKFTGKNFIIDPRVKAKVTVVSSNTMSADEVYEVFLSVLQVHGYAAVPTGTVIKIVPEVNAKQGPLPLVTSKTKKGTGDELITKIIRLDHVPAAQLVPILRPLVPQQGHLAAYAPTNTLIITDHAGNIQRIVDIIAGVDRAESDELEIIQLKHAAASELVRIINSLYQTTGKADTNKITIAADDRTNSILITGDRSARLKARTTIMTLDMPLEDGGNTHVIYLKYAKAENMVSILSGIQDSVKSSSSSRATGNAAAAAAKARKTASAFATTAVIQSDEETNALIITADPNTLRSLKAVIRQLDIRRAQVLIEAIIAEITENKNKDVGVGMIADSSDADTGSVTPAGISNLAGLSNLLIGALGGTEAAASALGNIGQGLTLGLGKTNSDGVRYGLILRALATDASSNILSTPSIVTLDNEEAEIIVGQNVPFITGQFTNTGSSDPSNPFTTIERQDVGLTLRVTPQINEGDTVKLDLEQEVSSVIAITETSGPVTRKRSIKTSVLVDDGGILILGGLMEETVNDTISKVPLLGDIPLLGKLFTSESTGKDKQNLMVFLRPSILRDDKDAAYVTNEKYSYLRSLQLQQDDDGYGLLEDKPPVLPPLQPQMIDKAQVKANPAPEPELHENEDEDFWEDEDDLI
jgi:general secretion pathway protein D